MRKELDLSKRSSPTLALEEGLLSSFRRSTFDPLHRDYLPETCINELVTRSSIREVLKLDEPSIDKLFDKESQEELICWIISQARKLFAITFECTLPPLEMLAALERFQNSSFTDTKIPVSNPREDPTISNHFREDVWSEWRLHHFCQNQWKYLAPVFTPGEDEYNLSSECIFPFERSGGPPKEGRFGAVYKVKVHQNHLKGHIFDFVAVKEIKITRSDDRNSTDTAWELEAGALRAITKLNHPHIVKCIAAIRRGDSRYFMFPWADGGNLREFWVESKKNAPNKVIIEQAVNQLRGIADALHHLHHFAGDTPNEASDQKSGQEKEVKVKLQSEVGDYVDAPHSDSIRHGDIKPENFLRFPNSIPGLGELKIADMGLAKRHVVATQERPNLTTTRYGTILYEAPEAVTAVRGLSRLYDIWSMGCITLEFIIWILYGNDELNNFYDQMKGGNDQCRYFEMPSAGTANKAVVHRTVTDWMDHIQKDPECSQDSAIRDLLYIVRTKLLVVPLPPRRQSTMGMGPSLAPPAPGESVTNYRATALEFRDALDNIRSKFNQLNYLVSGNDRQNAKGLAAKSGLFLSVIPAQLGNGTNPVGGLSTKSLRNDYFLPPLKDWEYLVDEPFADKVLKKIGYRALAPRSSVPAKLCRDCNGRVFWKGGFTIEDTKENFRTRAYDCQFCEILYDICMKPDAPRGPKVLIERHQSVLKLNSGSPLPILSIVRSNSLKPPIAIQLGFPELPEPGTDVFFHIINEWLNDCDHNTNHKDCKGFHQTRLPTRLIDVGTKDSQILRLIETHEDPIETKEYIALSHPWGDPEKHPPFRTLPKDEVNGRTVENFKKAIPYNELPATFQDAIITTRAIGMRYLWIDCICIIQGPDGDFKQEAERMEDVYSGAYCVLAASRATGVRDGFLGKRAQRKYLTFKRGDEEPFYMCEPIDNFSHDVLEGSVMNRRGWILQERALARRTVFFARNQTYFECGNGVRCETLAQLHNNLADFLGDPKFPEKSIRQNRGRKIVYFQDLYKQYSRLEFKEIEDRPIAIAGLENRLRTAYKTGGKFGIFDDGPGGGLFHRSLLWVRGEEECDDKTLSPIEFSEHRNIRVPTWSWMAYKGGIDYLEPPFKTTDWAGAEVQPAWSSAKDSTSDRTNMDAEIALVATVRNYNVAGRKSDDPFKLVYDTDRTGSDGQQPQCVIVAKPKDGITEREKTYYVLIVTLTSSTDKGKIYRRLGAGYMHAKFIIGLNAPGTEGLIC